MNRVWALFLALILGNLALAEDRVLIVGIYEYNPVLRGPDKDADLMHEIAIRLGFKPAQIRVLKDKQATREGILRNLEDWLVKGTKAGERAIFYFSGHGTQVKDANGDEDDGCDEAIVAQEGRTISDDELDAILKRVPASEMMVFLDSCFSGTATKSPLQSEENIKLWPKAEPGLVCASPANIRSIGVVAGKASDPFITLSAAAQNEVALGRTRVGGGSAFTQALYDLVARSGGTMSFMELRDQSAGLIREVVRQGSRFLPHTPQLEGPHEWLTKSFNSFGKLSQTPSPAQPYTGDIQNATGPADLLDRILNTSQFQVHGVPNKTSFKLGENLEFKFFTSKAGYLNILELGADGKLYVLFPNQFNSNNAVKEGELISVPSSKIGNFRLIAIEPIGKSRVVALVTSTPLNLFTEGLGTLEGQFKVFEAAKTSELSGVIRRNIAVAAPAEPATPPARDPPPANTPPPPNPPAANPPTPNPPTPTIEHGAGEVVIEVVK